MTKFKKIGMLTLPLLAFLISGCSKDEEPSNAISSEEAAELIGSVFASDNGGIVQMAAYTTAINDAENPANGRINADCGELVNVNFVIETPPQAIRKVNFSYDFEVRFTCDPSMDPLSFTTDMTASGTYDGPNFGSSLIVSLDWVVDQILNAEQPLLLDGAINVEASSENKINGNAYTFTVFINATDVAINKTTGFIQSGTASLSIQGNAPTGSFNFVSISLSFESGNQASLIIGGQKFSMDLRTGVITG